MSWAENEKLNEWIERAFENGKREEQERIIELIAKTPFIWMGDVQLIQISRDKLIELIKEKSTECECDPCDNPDCKCRGKRCSFCIGQDENR